MLPYLVFLDSVPAWGTVPRTHQPPPTRRGVKKLVPSAHYHALGDAFLLDPRPVAEIVYDPSLSANGVRTVMKRILPQSRVVTRGGRVYLDKTQK